MKKVSKKTASRDRRIDKIKRSMNDECFLCRRSGCDPAHILPKSLFGRYADKDWNIIPLCRDHHTLFDDDRHFRCQCLQIKQHVEKGLSTIKDEEEREKLQMSINNHFSI